MKRVNRPSRGGVSLLITALLLSAALACPSALAEPDSDFGVTFMDVYQKNVVISRTELMFEMTFIDFNTHENRIQIVYDSKMKMTFEFRPSTKMICAFQVEPPPLHNIQGGQQFWISTRVLRFAV